MAGNAPARARAITLGYPVELTEEADGSWTASVPDLPGCLSAAPTAADAVAGLAPAIDLWMEAARSQGLRIPAPSRREEFSGRFVLRVPRALHRSLVREARRQGVSLNAYCTVALAQAVARGLAESGLEDVAVEREAQRSTAR